MNNKAVFLRQRKWVTLHEYTSHRKTQESNLYLHNLWLLHTELVYVVVVLECEEQCIGTTRRKVFIYCDS